MLTVASECLTSSKCRTRNWINSVGTRIDSVVGPNRSSTGYFLVISHSELDLDLTRRPMRRVADV